jgi:hypothetical protein
MQTLKNRTIWVAAHTSMYCGGMPPQYMAQGEGIEIFTKRRCLKNDDIALFDCVLRIFLRKYLDIEGFLRIVL